MPKPKIETSPPDSRIFYADKKIELGPQVTEVHNFSFLPDCHPDLLLAYGDDGSWEMWEDFEIQPPDVRTFGICWPKVRYYLYSRNLDGALQTEETRVTLMTKRYLDGYLEMSDDWSKVWRDEQFEWWKSIHYIDEQWDYDKHILQLIVHFNHPVKKVYRFHRLW
ncbi:MAG: hypothetical protein ACXABY_04190, partial [Candidatus Thorarchaeota archaeon]